MTRMIIKHAALRAAFRWYSEAVVSSSAAPEVSTAMLEMFDSILSVLVLSPTGDKDQTTKGNGERQQPLVRVCGIVAVCTEIRRTNHATLLGDQSPQITEYLRQLMNPSLDLTNLRLTFVDQFLLVRKFVRR